MSQPVSSAPIVPSARRTFLRALLSSGGLPALLGLIATRAATGQSGGSSTGAPGEEAQAFMRRAFELRRLAEDRGDQPYGAVVVRDGRIVGEGASGVVVRQDPTAHGEMEAIRDACRRLGSRDLRGATLYSSARPCPMCETAAYWAGIARMYFGTGLVDGGAPRYPSC